VGGVCMETLDEGGGKKILGFYTAVFVAVCFVRESEHL